MEEPDKNREKEKQRVRVDPRLNMMFRRKIEMGWVSEEEIAAEIERLNRPPPEYNPPWKGPRMADIVSRIPFVSHQIPTI
jgi:hypothetical protein